MSSRILFRAIASLIPVIVLASSTTIMAGSDQQVEEPNPRPRVEVPRVEPQIKPRVPQSIEVRPSAVNLEGAKVRVINQIYQGELGNRALFASPTLKASGAQIASWSNPNQIVVERNAWFFFVDEQPGANWEHAARYILVDQVTGEVQSVNAMTPPQDVIRLRPMNRAAEVELQQLQLNERQTSLRLFKVPIRLLKHNRYAVLLNGGFNSSSNYSRYWNDLSFIYKALKEKYGYQDSEIIVLYANGTHSPTADLDGNGTNDIDYAATKANLTTAMNSVAPNISNTGKFFFYSTNHGGTSGGYNAHLYLWGEWITDAEFANLSKAIKTKNAIYVMEQCFSGGMMDDLLKAQTYPCSNPEVCVMTAARHDEPSWSADTEGSYDEYVYHWTSAVYGRTPTGTAVNADANGDRKISMAEAHDYAKSRDSASEHPLAGSCMSTACSNATL